MATTEELIEAVDTAILLTTKKVKDTGTDGAHHCGAGVHELVQARALLKESAEAERGGWVA